MAACSNRSPSPLFTRPVNQNIRNLEYNIGARRSLSRNPFSKPSVFQKFLLPPYPRSFYSSAPVNRPSDFARRRSLGREGIVASRDREEKENNEIAHNLKAAKIQQVAMGSMNCKSPKISAVSKFSPSPKKKVLVPSQILIQWIQI
ncbi:uncharacterized protein Fot_11434 [Forsythia ovata]|uniref:Uncharacterized protein n=1 Tax=Forsythia ovata TaxID=205694 RepID=A0ABD1WJM2_9LAMI